MKKIKFFATALVALAMSVGFMACSDSDDSSNVSNMERYQQEVENAVRAEKTKNKVILLVAFGSTWQQAYDAFDLTRKEYQKAFPDYDVFLSFSSAICINRAAAGENTAKRNFYEPMYWLEAFGRVQYSEIIVQSMQVIPGEEFSRVVNAMKDFGNNKLGDLDDKYMSKFAFDEEGNPGENVLKLGMPLMYTEDDTKTLATELDKNFSKYASMGAVLFMGHGNPDEYDTYKANVRYTQLETALQIKNPNYFVGTVDMADNFKVQVNNRMKAAGFAANGKVFCAPLMSIAGDHAHNDMAGDDDAWAEEMATQVEGEAEDVSWKKYFGHMGYTIQETPYYTDNGADALVKGLLEYKNIRDLYIQHTKDAEAVDFYHSMYPGE
ncbi:MAG: sirohydrochlorin cobaltochelatase [Bacteroidaceae bacterium]|nr:sirohydrochlorin cobaltochelatase [Bacteroidaceae bacterium]